MAVIVSKQIVVPELGKRASDYAVGESVFLSENGSPVEYLVINQGNPDTGLYDTSCDGTWVRRLHIPETEVYWNVSGIGYNTSNIHNYLQTTFLNYFSDVVKNAIKPVKIPYSPNPYAVSTGTNGLSASVFLLSILETGWVSPWGSTLTDGAKLQYYDSGDNTTANNKRLARKASSGSNLIYATRSLVLSSGNVIWSVTEQGRGDGSHTNTGLWPFLPALILYPETLFDINTNVIKG